MSISFIAAALLRRRGVVVPIVVNARLTRTSAHSQKHRFTVAGANTLVEELNAEERKLLKEAIQKKEAQLALTRGPPDVPRPQRNELYKLAFHQSLPFIGFGFLDNLVMIIAGESIDASIGASLAISTMAAAALGNTLSDVFGIGSAWYVEHWAAKLGVSPPALSLEQLELKSSRVAANLGRALGVVIGCLLGMFPLLFYENENKDDQEGEEEEVVTKEVKKQDRRA